MSDGEIIIISVIRAIIVLALSEIGLALIQLWSWTLAGIFCLFVGAFLLMLALHYAKGVFYMDKLSGSGPPW